MPVRAESPPAPQIIGENNSKGDWSMEPQPAAPAWQDGLLAVDVGLRTGLALYARDGRLLWVRSRHVGSLPQLRRTAAAMLRELPGLARVVLEGGGPAAEIWQRAATERSLSVVRVSAETWRPHLLLPREQRSGHVAKQHAERLAVQVIRWSGHPSPRRLSDDAAEAVLIGLWGVLDAGWLPEPPEVIRVPRTR